MQIAAARRKIAKAARSAATPGYRDALIKHRVAPSFEHQRLISPHHYDLIIDVGANRGQFSLLAHHLFPDARIVAFEPHHAAAQTFRQVLPTIDLRQVAVTDHNGTTDFHVCRISDGSSTLPFTGSVETLTVPSVRLDDELADIDGADALLKIDVQGAEGTVLAGAVGILPWFRHVLVELSLQPAYHGQQPHGRQVIDMLAAHGFELAAADSPAVRDGVIVGFDGFFARAG